MVQKLNPARSEKTIVGLTGSFGSGKSTVAHFFSELGAYIVDADRFAHEALVPGSDICREICEAFPEASFDKKPGLDPRKIAKIVFSDPRRRKRLESIIHPYVFERIADEIGQAEEKVVIADVPLLFESGYDRFCDKTIVVKATEEVMEKRLCEKGFTREEINSRWKAQMPLAEKIKRADEVIDNSETFQKTRTRVEEVWKTLHACSKGAK